MNITEFLETRIAEDEELATRAAGGSNGRWKRWGDEARVEGDNMIVYDEGGHSLEQAEHIARHDPAPILAECAAKRAIIALHEYEWMGPDDAAGKGCAHDYADWPCPTIRALAAVYADHPDYQQEWTTP